MKTRKYMTIALAAAMLTLVGCGNKNDSSSVSDVPASTEASTEAAETTTTAVETTTVETTAAEATEPNKSAGDSMAFADMADAIDKAMSAHVNDPADTADDMLKLCRATIEDLKANGLPLGEFTGDAETYGLDENGESKGEHYGTVSASVWKMPASTLSVSDIEGITLKDASSHRMHGTNPDGTSFDSYFVNLTFNIGDPENVIATHKACENIFSYFVENGYVDAESSAYNMPIEDAVEFARTDIVVGLDSGNCGVTVKNDKFEITILPDTTYGTCSISFTKL